MKEAVIVSAVRTAIGRAPRGTLSKMRPETLGAEVIKEALRRVPQLSPSEIDDVVVGCAFPEAEQGMNLGRVAALKAGLPDTVPGQTVNRFCASGLEAIATASQRIMCGFADVVVAGGVEMTSQVPMAGNHPLPDPSLMETWPGVYITMGLTAEKVARQFNINREDQDEFALRSHKKTINAIQEGKFTQQIVPIPVTEKGFEDGRRVECQKVFEQDECVRFDTSIEALAKLKPAFHIEGTVTGGNSCPLNDGAAAVVIMSRDRARQLGLIEKGVFRSYAVGGVPPEIMGIGPVVAVPKALHLAGISTEQVDLMELNEAFASQSLYVIRTLGIDPEKVNVNGGSIAIGHPFGCTGAYLTTKLLYEMEHRNARFGVVTMCVAGGMGAAAVFERDSR